MRKKLLITFGIFLTYLAFSYGVFKAQVKLYGDTLVTYSGDIVSIIGFQESNEKLSFCVIGPMKSRENGEYQIDLALNPEPKSAWSEYTPHTGSDGIKWLYPKPEEIHSGCDSSLKKTNLERVSLARDSGRIILIKTPGQPAINVVVKTVAEFHSTEKQKVLSKVLDIMDPIAKPGHIIIGMFAIFVALPLGIITLPD